LFLFHTFPNLPSSHLFQLAPPFLVFSFRSHSFFPPPRLKFFWGHGLHPFLFFSLCVAFPPNDLSRSAAVSGRDIKAFFFSLDRQRLPSFPGRRSLCWATFEIDGVFISPLTPNFFSPSYWFHPFFFPSSFPPKTKCCPKQNNLFFSIIEDPLLLIPPPSELFDSSECLPAHGNPRFAFPLLLSCSLASSRRVIFGRVFSPPPLTLSQAWWENFFALRFYCSKSDSSAFSASLPPILEGVGPSSSLRATPFPFFFDPLRSLTPLASKWR